MTSSTVTKKGRLYNQNSYLMQYAGRPVKVEQCYWYELNKLWQSSSNFLDFQKLPTKLVNMPFNACINGAKLHSWSITSLLQQKEDVSIKILQFEVRMKGKQWTLWHWLLIISPVNWCIMPLICGKNCNTIMTKILKKFISLSKISTTFMNFHCHTCQHSVNLHR